MQPYLRQVYRSRSKPPGVKRCLPSRFVLWMMVENWRKNVLWTGRTWIKRSIIQKIDFTLRPKVVVFMSRFGQKWFRSSRILISKVLLYICTHDPMTKKVLCFTIEEVPILKAHTTLPPPFRHTLSSWDSFNNASRHERSCLLEEITDLNELASSYFDEINNL